ncbi:MAG: pseudaminic acid synthase [Acidimicrobiales bacterium]
MPHFAIGDRQVGPGHRTYVIAELSANHGGSYDRAVELVRLAAEAGADAVKVQTYRPDTMTLDLAQEPFVVSGGTLWDGRTLHDLYTEAMTPWEWHAPLQAEARQAGVDFFSSPFDAAAVDLLVDLDVPVLKIASFELVDHGLIRYAAATGRPLIMSTGMATADEIDEALAIAREAGAAGIALLRCNSAYPAPNAEMDLRTIVDMQARWDLPIGLSDHTLGTTAAVVAVSLGACILEKHFTLSRAEPGPDSAFSLEPVEFAAMVAAVREAEAVQGGIRYGPSRREQSSVAFRRSLFAVADIDSGQPFTEENVRAIRPGQGLAPKHLAAVLGRRARCRIERGTPLSWELIGNE